MLQPENLFVVSSNNSSVGGLKIADFGLARLLAQDKSGHHSSSIGMFICLIMLMNFFRLKVQWIFGNSLCELSSICVGRAPFSHIGPFPACPDWDRCL